MRPLLGDKPAIAATGLALKKAAIVAKTAIEAGRP